MSRKQQRLHRKNMKLQAEQIRQEKIENTVVEVTFEERITPFSGLPFNEKSEDQQLYIEVPDTVERHITFKRKAA